MNVNYLKMIVAVTAAVLLTSFSVRASEASNVRQVSGEITWIDINLGKLQIKSETSPGAGEILEFRVTEHETRVTDPTDTKFLTLEDLRPGEYITIDVIKGKEDKIVQKITADPAPESDFQQAYGEIEAIDVPAGTLILEDRPRGEAGESNLSYFLFDPEDTLVMQSPSSQSVQLELKPGDVVKVEFVVSDGKRWINSITRYAPQVTSTTTTTTTTTTQ